MRHTFIHIVGMRDRLQQINYSYLGRLKCVNPWTFQDWIFSWLQYFLTSVTYMSKQKLVQRNTIYFLILWTYRYFPEDTTCAVLFRDIVPTDWNLIKIVVAVFKQISVLCLARCLCEGPLLLNEKVHIHCEPTYDEYIVNIKYK
jgi:hypothetical protein